MRTVIQIGDIAHPERRQELITSFILTAEVEAALSSILAAVAGGRGKGFFVQGNYGSGKSHLLSILSLALANPRVWEELLAKEGGDRLQSLAGGIAPGKYAVVNISLVEHPGREDLENIVLGAIAQACGITLSRRRGSLRPRVLQAALEAYPEEVSAFLAERGLARAGDLLGEGHEADLAAFLEQVDLPWRLPYERQKAAGEIKKALAASGQAGLVILIDELSEFLRSKPDGRSFNEDVRFLQFLGEQAENLPAWIVATLQENIENTGEIPPQVFNKIKDRYPARLHLAGGHIRELISRRLIRKKEGAAQHISRLYRELHASLGKLDFAEDEFISLYPVHPATVFFLEQLRPLFSQHRGVVDFIHHRLRGDPTRGIPGLLGAPWDTLLAPDLIFDHFRDRLRETAATSALSERVFAYYEREIGSLFPDPEEQQLALRLLKILILATAVPVPFRVTVPQLTHYLLYTFSQLDTAANYEYVGQLLSEMAQKGRYVSQADKDVYVIDLEADVGDQVRREVDYQVSTLFPEDKRLVRAFLPWLDRPYLPLQRLAAQPAYRAQVSWQNTLRQVAVTFTSLVEITREEVEAMVQEALAGETDMALFLDYPLGAGLPDWLPGLLSRKMADGFCLFWRPQPLPEMDFIRETLGYLLVREQYTGDMSARGEKVLAAVEAELTARKLRVEQIFSRAYFGGRIVNGRGEVILEPQQLGLPSLEHLLGRLAEKVLNERYPQHHEIRPRVDVVPAGLQQRALEEFLLPGQASSRLDNDLRQVIEGWLLPLGLARQTAGGYQVNIDPRRNRLVAAVLGEVGTGNADMAGLYRKLRKGPYGLSGDAFRLLLLTLAASGAVTLVAGRAIPPSQLSVHNFARVEAVRPGELLPPEYHQLLLQIPWLPANLRRGPVTFSSQQGIWQHVVQFKEEMLRDLAVAEASLAGKLPDEEKEHLLAEAGKLEPLLQAIKDEKSSQEGLVQFLRAYEASPYWEQYRDRLETLADFCRQHLEGLLSVRRYLHDPRLVIPEEVAYEQLRRRRRDLVEAVSGLSLFFDPAGWQQVREAFAAFLREYTVTYTREHQGQRGQRLFGPYLDFPQEPVAQALAALARIEVVHVADPWVKVERLWREALAHYCSHEPDLEAEPACRCGFSLGEKTEVISLQELRAIARRGLGQHLAGLQAEPLRGKLAAYASQAAQVGRGEVAAAIEKLLALPAADPPAAEIAALVTPEVARAIREALVGKALIVSRNLGQLYREVAGRTLSVSELRRLFEAWLAAAELPEGSYVRVEEGSNRPGAEEEDG